MGGFCVEEQVHSAGGLLGSRAIDSSSNNDSGMHRVSGKQVLLIRSEGCAHGRSVNVGSADFDIGVWRFILWNILQDIEQHIEVLLGELARALWYG